MSHSLAGFSNHSQLILETLPSAVLVADIQGRIVSVNPFAEKLLDVSRERLLEKNLFKTVFQGKNRSEKTYASVFAEFLAAPGKEDSIEVSDVFSGNDGLERCFVWNCRPLRNEAGVPEYWICCGSDTTSLKQEEIDAERRLRQNQETFERALEMTRTGIWTFDLPSGRYSPLSQALCNIIGETEILEDDLAYAEALSKIAHPEDLGEIASFFSTDLQLEKEIVFRIAKPNGEFVFVDAHAIPVFDDRFEQTGQIGFFRDASERLKTEKLLKERELSLFHALRVSRAGIWELDPSTESLDLSDMLCELLGQDREEPITLQQMIANWVYPDDRQKVWEALCLSLVQGNDFDLEYRMLDTRGEIHYLKQSGVVVRDNSNQVSKIIGVVLDMTAFKRRELEILDNEAKYYALFEQSNNPICLIEDFRIIECNNRFQQLFGATVPEQLIGKTPADLSPDRQPNGRKSADFAQESDAQVQTGNVLRLNWRAKRLDGSEFDAEMSLTRIPREKGTTILSQVRDVSEEKRAAFVLEQYQGYLSVFAETRKFFYGQTESEILQGFLNNLVHHFELSKAWIGEIEDDVLRPNLHAGPAKNYEDVTAISPASESGVKPFPLAKAIENGTTLVIDELQTAESFAPWKHFASRAHVKTLLAIPLEIDGQIRKGMVFYSPISGYFDRTVVDYIENCVRELERTLSEKRFWEKQKADLKAAREATERAAFSRTRFLANMSHEIRTPMTVILGYADLFSDSRISKESVLEAGKIIRNNAGYLLQILNDILDLSKIEAHKLAVDIQETELGVILAEVSALFASRAEEKGIALEVVYNTPIPKTIQTDRFRLKQVMVNLLGNAIKFTDKGSVRVEASWQSGNTKTPAGLLSLEVIDSGIGISKDRIGSIFYPFQQGSLSTAKTFGGTGLGLSISRNLVEALEGSLDVRSEEGRGSIFRILLAQQFSEEPIWIEKFELLPPGEKTLKPTVAPPPEKPLRGLRILLAEDGFDNQRLFKLILSKAGASVDLANNGEEALKKALRRLKAEKPYDLILMDVQMPIRDGYSATRELRRRHYTAPIVALTAHAMGEEKNKCLEAGCNDYATKPIFRDALIKAILKNCPRKPKDKKQDRPKS